MDRNNVALYLDFENLAISAENVYPSQDKPLAIEPIVDFAASKGNISVRKAYADWSRDIFAQYQNLLMEQGFELIHLPGTNFQGKNGSDVRLTVDVMEHLELFPHFHTLIIGSGDSDFIPLIQRVRLRNIKVVIIGFEHSVGRLVKKNSAEFKALEDLLGEPEAESPSSDIVEEIDHSYGKELLLRFIRNRSGDDPVLMAQLKQHLLRLDPSFSEKELGYPSFKRFLQSMENDVVDKIEIQKDNLPVVYLKDVEDNKPKQADIKENALQFLSRKIRYQKNAPKRLKITESLFEALHSHQPISMNQMFDMVAEESTDRPLARTEIKKYINTLFTGGAFKSDPSQSNGPLLSRPFQLKETVTNPEALDQIYIQRIGEILQSRYPALNSSDILELLV